MMRECFPKKIVWLLVLLLALTTGCGSGLIASDSSNALFSITPGTGAIDTNCTGCNAANAHGAAVQQFTATLASGGAAEVSWSVSGGDAVSGPGTITASGQYTPPGYLTADRVEVRVTATLHSATSFGSVAQATAVLTVTPGFLQPLTPVNLALGSSGSVTITGVLAEAGGSTAIDFFLADTANGESGSASGLGTLGAVNCQRGGQSFTSCSVTYTAPAALPATGMAYVVARAGSSSSKTSAAVLLNAEGIFSNPATHQGPLPALIHLGSSGGNNNDYDLSGNRVKDCCSGTLGALVQDSGSRLYLLSNNHVLARSDQASVGDAIVQPGLIDNNCTPSGSGSGVTAIAALHEWLPLRARSTNVDAAIAQVSGRSVDPAGSILEFGARQANGTLAAAPPGVSSTGGKGEAAALSMRVAKSGRTTGLTCGNVTALDLDVTIDYFRDCAETRAYLTKTFTSQIAVSGNAFADAGDSGALLVDAATAEPVGLFFAGGRDVAGVSQAIANPANEVLSELAARSGSGSVFSFVGGADHAVSCLSYGNSAIAAAQARTLSATESARAESALGEARALVNASTGILAVAAGKSSDHPGEAAIFVYVDESMNPSVPAEMGGVRTLVIPVTARAAALGQLPKTPLKTVSGSVTLSASALSQAIAVKRRLAAGLMKRNPAFFGVGVGQSLDNPREAALVIYVDRQRLPDQLPRMLGGLRTRYIVMDRLHVTRSYALPQPSKVHCLAKPVAPQPTGFEWLNLLKPLSLKLD
jgi:hypothetical protein